MREEENYVQRSYKSDSDRRQKDWRRQPDFNPVRKIGKFQNYLLTIAVNTCNNYTKKAKPLYMDLETLEDIEDTDNAFEKIELNELKAQIQYAINTLPDYQKEVIILRFYYDLKIREIATITKASVSTVKSRLQQGIKKLERYLADFRGGDNV